MERFNMKIAQYILARRMDLQFLLQDAWSHDLDLQIHADEDGDEDEQKHVKMGKRG